MAEPFISPLGLTICSSYCQHSSYFPIESFPVVSQVLHCVGGFGSGSSSGCTHNTSVVLEVQENTVGALPGLGLADDNGGVDLLAELGLSLLDGGHAIERVMSANNWSM